MAQYTAVFTTYGTQQLAKAIANNNPLTVTHFAVGDGNGNAVTVSASQERLVNEKYRATISAVSLDPRNNKQVVFELTIPENVGGFYLREMGVFDAQNKLIAYANCPESFKPTLASGSGKVQVMRMILLVASSNAVTLTVDDSVIFVTRGQLTPKTITANSANGFDNTGHSHAIDKASTTKAGIVQLTSDTGLESENLGLTAKAGKVLAQGIAALRLALNNYIPLKSRSSSVTSNDENGVATPKAVKTAYDKGVEAKQAADGAQRTANEGVAKANAAQNSADNAQRSANDGINRANNAQNSANDGINRANNAQLTAEAANRNANTRVAKSGDTMDGDLTVPNINTGAVISSGYLNISSENGVAFYKNNQRDYLALLSDTGFDIRKVVLSPNGYRANNLGYGGYGSQYDYSAPFEVIEAGGNSISTYYPFIKGKVMSRGNSGAAFSLGYTTKQANYYEYGNFGRGVINLVEDNGSFKNWEFEHTGVFRSAGDVITGNGNSLNWYTHVLNSLIGGITFSSYGSHYQGADVFKIKQNRLMIIRMQIGVVNSSGDYYLPESFDGSASAIAIDSGGAVNPVGAFFKGGNTIYISVTKPTNVTVIAIGVKN